MLEALDAMKIVEGDAVHWPAKGPCMMGSHGQTGDLETTAEEALEILRGLRPKWESHHGVSIEDAALAAAVKG